MFAVMNCFLMDLRCSKTAPALAAASLFLSGKVMLESARYFLTKLLHQKEFVIYGA
jgi:hypothetical protein